MLLYERTSNVEHDSGLIFENRPKNGHFRPFFVWQFCPILRLGFEHSFFYPSKCVPIVFIHLVFNLTCISLSLLNTWNTCNIFWFGNLSNLPTKFIVLGKRRMISIKKLRHVTPPVQAKALQLLHAKAFEPLKLNDQYVRPPAQAQLKLRTFWWKNNIILHNGKQFNKFKILSVT